MEQWRIGFWWVCFGCLLVQVFMLGALNGEVFVDNLVGYLITFTTYGTWLHGDSRGSVNDVGNCYGTPFLPTNSKWQGQEKSELKSRQFVMVSDMREIALKTIMDVCEHRGWWLYAAHVRSNHIHLVVDSKEKPEKIMRDMKAWGTRRLRDCFSDLEGKRLWTKHGSTKYLWYNKHLQMAINYVVKGQGKPMSVYENCQSRERE